MTYSTAPWNFSHIDEVTRRSDDDAELFAELHEVLDRHGAANRFGVSLLHTHFDLDDDEVLLETTDIEARTQIMRPVKVADLEVIDFVTTSWSLETGSAIMRCTCLDTQNGHVHGETN